MTKIIYVASPYNHSDKNVIERRMKIVNRYCADLFNEGYTFISPLSTGHAFVTEKPDIDTSFEHFKEWCENLMTISTEIHIICQDGWDVSNGVKFEIEYAKNNNLTIKYIHDYE